MADALSRDPYKTFRFKVSFKEENKEVAAVNSVGGLSWKVDVVSHEEGGNHKGHRKTPGRVSYEPVTLSRGITTNTAFQEWAERVWNYDRDNPLENYRKTLVITLCDENGKGVISYSLDKCWVSSYDAMPELSADDNALAIEKITVEHEGWTQEYVKNSSEPGRQAGQTT